ncbi:hypothetical protein ACIA8R_52290 [Nonomuraea sp. NPDC051191]|uniref:hypothetical protein n=1 Tax=Nonomuraea sp. NPDC051191 TaxID=3364372 RepID=UPI003789310B
MGGNWTQGPPVPGTGHQLVSFADDSYEAVYFAEGKNSGNKPGTPAVAGDPDDTTASTVIWNVSYWRAGWWTTATDEPGKSAAWKRLGPAMLKVSMNTSPDSLAAAPSPTTGPARPSADPPTGPREGLKPTDTTTGPHPKPTRWNTPAPGSLAHGAGQNRTHKAPLTCITAVQGLASRSDSVCPPAADPRVRRQQESSGERMAWRTSSRHPVGT